MDYKSFAADKYELHYLSYHGLMDHITKLTTTEKYINEKDVKGCTPLHLACAQNHTQVVKSLINLGADVNCQDKNLSTALHWAVYNNNIELVKLLIERNADVKIQDSNGIQSIHLAALKGHIEIFNILISLATGGEITDKLGITPLHLASHCGHDDVIRALLETGSVDVNVTDKNSIQALHLATGSNHIKSVELLLQKGASTSYFDYYDRLPIHWASLNGNIEALKSLTLKSNIDAAQALDAMDKFKYNPLFLATTYGHDEAVNILLQNNHALNLESGQKEMYLMLTTLEGPDGVINKYFDELVSLPGILNWAVAFCSKSIVERLLDSGADIEEKGAHENTPLHTAASFGNKDVVELLIDRGAQIDPLDKDESTPLHWAVSHCHLEIIQLLLDKGANKRYALSWAASGRNLNIVKLLVENGCDVNESDNDTAYSHTPLMWAAICGQAEIIEYLIENGAEIINTIINFDIIHWCATNGLVDTIKMLIERGVDVNELDLCFSRTPLHCAAIVGNVEVIKYLLSVDGIDVNAEEDNCDLPIKYAVNGNHHEVMKMLIEHGADINNEDGYMGIPVLIAAENGNLKTLEILIDSGVNLNPEDSSPLAVAVSNGHFHMIDYLLEKGADRREFIHSLAKMGTVNDLLKYMKPGEVHALDLYNKQTPLFYALHNVSNVKFLIENGADVNHRDNENKTPLYLAIDYENLDCVRILVSNGANVNDKINDITPLMLAKQKDNLGIVEFLKDYCKANSSGFDGDDNLGSG